MTDSCGGQTQGNTLLADHEHRSMLRAYFSRQVGNAQDVEDYVQDVFVRVLSAAPGNGVGNWRAFLLRAAQTLMIDRFRRDLSRCRDRHQELDEGGEIIDENAVCPERAMICRQELGYLEEALSRIDPIARNIFLLVRVDGLRHREVAERLGMDTKAVTRTIDKVTAQLARRLGELER